MLTFFHPSAFEYTIHFNALFSMLVFFAAFTQFTKSVKSLKFVMQKFFLPMEKHWPHIEGNRIQFFVKLFNFFMVHFAINI